MKHDRPDAFVAGIRSGFACVANAPERTGPNQSTQPRFHVQHTRPYVK